MTNKRIGVRYISQEQYGVLSLRTYIDKKRNRKQKPVQQVTIWAGLAKDQLDQPLGSCGQKRKKIQNPREPGLKPEYFVSPLYI